jgi:hypothetical protein
MPQVDVPSRHGAAGTGAFLSSLEGSLDAAAGGHDCMVLVGGEAGGELAGLVATEPARHRLFSAFLDLLGPAGRTPPMIAVVEDAHWADEATLDPEIQGFDVAKPPILVYLRHGRSWQLGALEWVFPEKPATPPLPGATYGSFGAACHYRDGTFVLARVHELCAKRSPQTGARFNFWHPELVTLHVWLWYHNPDGLYSGTNPLVHPFNQG